MRYFDTKTHTETHIESDSTIPHTDDKVAIFFQELPAGKQIKFTDDGLPVMVDLIIPTQEELDVANKQSESLHLLQASDWKVIRELERLLLKDTELNIAREALRESIIN